MQFVGQFVSRGNGRQNQVNIFQFHSHLQDEHCGEFWQSLGHLFCYFKCKISQMMTKRTELFAKTIQFSFQEAALCCWTSAPAQLQQQPCPSSAGSLPWVTRICRTRASVLVRNQWMCFPLKVSKCFTNSDLHCISLEVGK